MLILMRIAALGLILLICFGLIGCTESPRNNVSSDIVGRWEIVNGGSLNVPHSFFWFSMSFIEFRADGTVLGLMLWPPDEGNEIRLNKTAAYTLLDDGQIEITGSCRHQDPCSGVYNLSLAKNALRLFDSSGTMELRWSGPISQGSIPTVIGPSASPTPSA